MALLRYRRQDEVVRPSPSSHGRRPLLDALERRRMLNGDVHVMTTSGCVCAVCTGTTARDASDANAITVENAVAAAKVQQAQILAGKLGGQQQAPVVDGADEVPTVAQPYQFLNRWTSTASGGTGSTGSPITLTWGLVPDGLSIPSAGTNDPSGPSNLRARLNALYGSQAAWLPLFQSVFNSWENATGVNYEYVTYDDSAAWGNSAGQLNARPDVRIGGRNIDGAFGILAYNFNPNGGDMVIDTSELLSGGLFTNTNNNSRAFRNTIAHEAGHGLGLAHVIPQNGTKLMEPSLNTNFDGPQFDDRLAVQTYYGDVYERPNRNDAVATAYSFGALPLGSQTLTTNASLAALNGGTADIDVYRFTLDNAATASFSLIPEGGSYQQGPQGGTATTFNASAAANLTFSLLNAAGTAVATVNATGAGGTETIASNTLPAGTYFLRVTGGSGESQAYRVTSTAVAGTNPPDLATASDSGVSSSDNVTNDDTPTFSGLALPNATVTVYQNGAAVGTALADNAGLYSFTVPGALADGTYSFTVALATGGGGPGPQSAATTLVVDTDAPGVALTYLFETRQAVRAIFDETLGSFSPTGSLSVADLTAGGTVPATPEIDSATPLEALFTFPGNTLGDARYRATTVTGAIADVAGNLLPTTSLDFFHVRADFNRDGTVNFQDLARLALNYNGLNRTFSQGDATYDGTIDFSDVSVLALTYNFTLPPLRPLAAVGTAGGARRVEAVARQVL